MKTKFTTMKTRFLSYLAILTFLAFGAALLFAPPVMASPNVRVYAATDVGAKYETGLSGDAVAGGAVSDSINMGEKFWGSTLDYQVTIIPGTTTAVVATCEESVDDSVWVKLMGCSNEIAATCEEKSMSYDVTTTPGFSLMITNITTGYIRCTFTGTGDGTISATATVGSP